ncbi:hypothetical protein AB0K18_42995 [Nonomuraea sp. NPDC049421]|uniref:hypothetical protein n=1 Tax=Nonomuraea sp. NPDC049421 TaxID=3155275 RepID=UPI00341C4FC5
MNLISNLLGLATAYAIGFYATVRAAHALDTRHHFLRKDDDWTLASVWPATLLVVVIAGPAVMLYRLATRDLR